MGFVKRLFSASGAEKAFNNALDIYQSLRRYPVKTPQYHQALLKIILLCQEAIASNNRHGDAHVLLANTYYLLHTDIFPVATISLPLKIAAAVIQHWSDEPMRQYPWTKNTDNGRRIYDLVSRALVMADPDLKYHEEQNMRKLKSHFYSKALTIKTLDELKTTGAGARSAPRRSGSGERLKNGRGRDNPQPRNANYPNRGGVTDNQKDFKETIDHLEYQWKHKWEPILGGDEKLKKMISDLGLTSLSRIGQILDKNSVSEEIGERIGQSFALHTHLSFIAGLEFAKFVARYIGPILDPEEITTRIPVKTAFETLEMGRPLLEYLAVSYGSQLFMALGENAFKKDQDKISQILGATLVAHFKVGIKIASYV